MKIRALDSTGDWQFGQGLASYNTGQNAIVEDIQTRLYSFLNDVFWAMAFGVDWWNLLSSKNPAAQNGIILQTRNMILGAPGGYSSFGVTGINSMEAYENVQTRNLILQYNIRTIYTTSYADKVAIAPTQL